MKFWNCSKILVDDLADFSRTWTGFDAKYFEECAQSNNAEVILYEKILNESNDPGVEWYGTFNAKSAKYCVNVFGTSSSSLAAGASPETDSTSIYHKMAYKTLANWAQIAYPDAFQWSLKAIIGLQKNMSSE